jgi:hypothetical protein
MLYTLYVKIEQIQKRDFLIVEHGETLGLWSKQISLGLEFLPRTCR